jgi:hypothetical protein
MCFLCSFTYFLYSSIYFLHSFIYRPISISLSPYYLI